MASKNIKRSSRKKEKSSGNKEKSSRNKEKSSKNKGKSSRNKEKSSRKKKSSSGKQESSLKKSDSLSTKSPSIKKESTSRKKDPSKKKDTSKSKVPSKSKDPSKKKDRSKKKDHSRKKVKDTSKKKVKDSPKKEVKDSSKRKVKDSSEKKKDRSKKKGSRSKKKGSRSKKKGSRSQKKGSRSQKKGSRSQKKGSRSKKKKSPSKRKDHPKKKENLAKMIKDHAEMTADHAKMTDHFKIEEGPSETKEDPSKMKGRATSVIEANSEYFENEEEYEKYKALLSRIMIVIYNYVGQAAYPFISTPIDLYKYASELFAELLEAEKYMLENEYVRMKAHPLENLKMDVVIEGIRIRHPVISNKAYIFAKLWVSKSNIQVTGSRYYTDELNWAEYFRLDIHNYNMDTIDFEIWITSVSHIELSADLAVEKPKKKKSGMLKSLSSCCTNVEEAIQSNTVKNIFFLGNASIKISDIACVRSTVATRLFNTMEKIDLDADIYVSLNFICEASSFQIQKLEDHVYLLLTCYTKAIVANPTEKLKFSTVWNNWLDILPVEALTLIHQHTLQSGFTSTEEALCLWIVLCAWKINKESRVSYKLLEHCLRRLFREVHKAPLAKECAHIFYKSATAFQLHAKNKLRTMHDSFGWKLNEQKEFFCFLSCIHVIHNLMDISTYTLYFPELEQEYVKYNMTIFSSEEDYLTDDIAMKIVIEGLKTVMEEILMNHIYVDQIFEKTWNVSYTKIVFKHLDKMMNDDIQIVIKFIQRKILEQTKYFIDQIVLLKMLQLHNEIKSVVDYVTQQLPRNTKLQMRRYPLWFDEKIIMLWFQVAKDQVGNFIGATITTDNLKALDPKQKIFYSSSVTEIMKVLDELVIEIWLNLPWEFQFDTHSLLHETINLSAIYYFEAIERNCLKSNFFCENDEFVFNERLCVSLTNVFSVYKHLLKLFLKMKKSIYRAQQEFNFAFIDSSSYYEKQLLDELFEIFCHVERRMRSLFLPYIVDVLECPSTKQRRQIVISLRECVLKNLQTMQQHMKREIYEILHRALWNSFLGALQSKMPLYSNAAKYVIYMILERIKKDFRCKGRGMLRYELENGTYQKIVNHLKQKTV